MATRSNNTMQEALQRLLGDLSAMKVLPDADLEFVINLETQIVAKLREPLDRMAQAGITDAPPVMPPMSMGAPTGAGMGVPGVRTEPNSPNPDELRRLLATG